MGRPRELPDAETKAFRLPSVLVKQLEAAAELRQMTTSAVVREILERSVRVFFDESIVIYDERLRISIAALEPDQELRELFEKYKDKPECPVPSAVLRNPRRLALLSTAVEAYKARQSSRGLIAELFSPSRDRSHELLTELAGTMKASLGRLLRQLAIIIDTGELAIEKESGGTVVFVVRPRTARLIDGQRLEIPGVKQLFKLIEGGRLVPVASGQGRQRTYQWSE